MPANPQFHLQSTGPQVHSPLLLQPSVVSPPVLSSFFSPPVLTSMISPPVQPSTISPPDQPLMISLPFQPSMILPPVQPSVVSSLESTNNKHNNKLQNHYKICLYRSIYGNCSISLQLLDNYIQKITSHAAICGYHTEFRGETHRHIEQVLVLF